ncbi:MAG: hypothetical protein U1F77_13940 [Kiritimatiellia bacterium]
MILPICSQSPSAATGHPTRALPPPPRHVEPRALLPSRQRHVLAGPWTPATVSPVATEPDVDGIHEQVDVLVTPPAGAGAWFVRIRVEGV